MYPAVPYNLHGICELHKIRQNELKKEKRKKLKQGKTLYGTLHLYKILYHRQQNCFLIRRHEPFKHPGKRVGHHVVYPLLL
jgi:hypothetical protein